MRSDSGSTGAIERLADELEAAYARGTLTTPPSAREGGLTLDGAYAVEAQLVRRRRVAGHRVVGAKVGFANKAMWRILKLDTLVWARMFEDTVHMVDSSRAMCSMAGRVSPRLEPEIVFKLGRSLEPGVADVARILDAIEWLALGYEINDCVFPEWKFQPADFVAAYGFHIALFVGPGRPPRTTDADTLSAFVLRLSRDGELVERGSGRNALRNPALCLAELVTACRRRGGADLDEAIGAGALVSTGTLTVPQPLGAGQIWQADADGLDLPPLTLEVASPA